ncbi:MAG: polyamine aminopropyltransferase [Patescibacteria group bacterium]|nr:polyamine aminopropyltransferase [Patescibacteria group bacterium]
MKEKKYTFEFHPTGKILEGKKANYNYAYGFAYDKLIYKGKTKYQKIELYETPWLGKLLKLDGYFQTSEKDEFFYHEAMTQPALFSHPNPKKVLIIGGGDCGILRQVLSHYSIKKVIMVEIDQEVIDFSKKYLKFIHKNSFKNPKVEIIVGDGKKFVEETKEKFDLIISDLTDPIGPSKALYTRSFYRKISSKLEKNGIFMTHLDLATTRPELSKWIYKNLKSVFKFSSVFVSYIPLYGSLMAFSINSNYIDATKIKNEIIQKRLKERKVKNLKWYCPKIHQAIFALPVYLKNLFKI